MNDDNVKLRYHDSLRMRFDILYFLFSVVLALFVLLVILLFVDNRSWPLYSGILALLGSCIGALVKLAPTLLSDNIRKVEFRSPFRSTHVDP